jgi:hypothetical protein
MAELKLLTAIRAQVAERGITLTDLARAAGVQPGNLRRMFASNAASPRLGSVMRLLPPLHCRVAPAGARTAVELAAYLDEQRRRQNLDWDQLLDQMGVGAEKIAASFLSDPDRLSLPVVMRLADALHVELTLVDDEAQSVGEKSTKKRSPASTRRSVPQSQTVQPAPLPTPVAQPPASSPIPEAAPPAAPSIGPLRPPRLGRYRDAPPSPPPVRPPPASWTRPEQPPVLAGALAPRLAELSGEQWGDVYALVWGALTKGASLPGRFIDGLGKMTADFLSRLRRPPEAKRPAVPDPPAGWYDALDPALLVRYWLASRQPDYKPTDVIQNFDEHGMRIGHIALDRDTMALVRLAPHGSPHRLVDLVHMPNGCEPRSCLHKEVPLAVKLGDELHLFRHVKAGPIFGELAVGDRIYLLAAVSSLLVIIEMHGERARIVWGGRAEKLPEVVIEPPSPGTAARTEEPAATVAELERRLAEAGALLAAERQARQEDRRSFESRGPDTGPTQQYVEKILGYVAELQTQLGAQAQERLEVEDRCLFAEARLKSVTKARDTLAAELAALRSDATTPTEAPTARVAELERHLSETEALLSAERRAREADRLVGSREQDGGQTRQHAENAMRYIAELQVRLATHNQERLEAEDRRLIAEDKRLLAEEKLKKVVQARDDLAAELDALRSPSTPHRSQPEQMGNENSSLRGAEDRARRAADEADCLAHQLAASKAQEQTIGDALAAAHQELKELRRSQVDEKTQIRELIAAKRFPEAVLRSIARSFGENDVEAVLEHFPPSDGGTSPAQPSADDAPGGASPAQPSADDAPSNTKIPAEAVPAVAAHLHRGRRNIISVAPPAAYPAYQAAHAVRQPGRNEACPCGSGKKFKKCCGLAAT